MVLGMRYCYINIDIVLGSTYASGHRCQCARVWPGRCRTQARTGVELWHGSIDTVRGLQTLHDLSYDQLQLENAPVIQSMQGYLALLVLALRILTCMYDYLSQSIAHDTVMHGVC